MCFSSLLERYLASVENSEEKEALEIKPLGPRPWRSLAQVAKKISISETQIFTKFSTKNPPMISFRKSNIQIINGARESRANES